MIFPWDGSVRFVLAPAFAPESARVDIEQGFCIELSGAADGLRAVLGFENRFSMMVDNYVEMETALLRLSVLNSVRTIHVLETMPTHRRTIDRLLLNLLASCRQYIDQNCRLVEPLLVQTGVSFKQECSKQYDGSLAYRLAEGLRNHVQHKDTGIHVITLSAGSVPHSDGLRYLSTVTLDANNLRDGEAVKTSVLGQVLAQETPPDLMLVLREYLGCLISIHKATQSGLDGLVAGWKAAIATAFVKHHSEFPATTPRDIFVLALPSEAPPERVAFLSQEVFTKLDEARGLNRSPAHLDKSFVSSESVPRKWDTK